MNGEYKLQMFRSFLVTNLYSQTAVLTAHIVFSLLRKHPDRDGVMLHLKGFHAALGTREGVALELSSDEKTASFLGKMRVFGL